MQGLRVLKAVRECAAEDVEEAAETIKEIIEEIRHD